ncbi:MAG: carboxypeptidase-like regulatory domain-containing protein [Candidatus Poribacteria bacterium]|nr:carboxypeptidase-like regulatory domain-containing protein [Candidatus Poribacteria bacterium]
MTRFSFVLILAACISISFSILWEGFVTPIAAENKVVNGGTLRGTITDTTPAQNPIEGVEVKIVAQDGTKYITKTDANGDYKHAGLPAGRYLVSIYKVGYIKRVGKPVRVVNGGDHFVPLKMAKKNEIGLHRIKSLLQRVGESTIQRYKLSKPNVEALSQSVLELTNTSLDAHEFALIESQSNAVILEFLLSHPDTKAVFAKHLNETQLADYINFNETQRQRDRLAAAQLMTAVLDQVLSLTTDQHQNVVPLLVDRMNDEPQLTSADILGRGPHLQLHYAIVNAIHRELNLSLDEILTPTQAKIWQGMVKREKIKRENGEIGVEVLKPKTDKINEREADLQSQDEVDPSESQLWQLTEVIIAAHTKLLGPLNEPASQRLALVTKGVVQQYFETQNEAQDDDFETKLRFSKTITELIEAAEAGKITREKALGKLNTIREEVRNQKTANIRSGKAEVYDIIDHPLYQQTIKDILSEDTLTQYNEHQIQRKTFCQQSLCDLTIALLDIHLLLDDTQRKHFEGIAAQLTVPPLTEEGLVIMLSELLLSIDRDILSPWQRGELEK